MTVYEKDETDATTDSTDDGSKTEHTGNYLRFFRFFVVVCVYGRNVIVSAFTDDTSRVGSSPFTRRATTGDDAIERTL